MINSRHLAVISDVELSVLKVSLLARVQLHEPLPPPTPSAAMTSSSSQPGEDDDDTEPAYLLLSTASAPASSRERKGAQLSAPVASTENSAAIYRMTLSRLLLPVAMIVRVICWRSAETM